MRPARLLKSAALAGVIALAGAASAQSDPVLTGSFVQLDGQLAALGPDGWRQELGYMRDLGFDTLIVQYSRYGEVSYYRAADPDPGAPPPARRLPPDESLSELVWRAPAPLPARFVRVTVTPNSREWTMIPEVRVMAGPDDVSAGLGYTLAPAPAGNYLDPDAAKGGKLTDGLANFAWADMVGWQNPGDRITITFELAAAGEARLFDAVAVQFMRSDISAVELPAAVAVSVSSDGQDFLPVGAPATWDAPAASTAAAERAERDPIGDLLGAAEEAGMSVWLGLGLDPEYWQGRFDGAGAAEANTALMRELEGLYGASPALAGYYLPEEIDDRSFVTPQAHEAMITYLAAMADAAHAELDRPVMVAPYFGINPNGATYAAWWDTTLARAAIDVIAMQDGVGTRRTTVEEGVPVYRALKAVADAHGVALWSDLELFEQTHGWPVDDLAWQATSAGIETVRRQLELEAPYVVKFVGFDFTHYMSPRLGGAAAELYGAYRQYLKEREP